MLALLMIAVSVVVGRITYSATIGSHILHLRVATALVPPSGHAVGGGLEELWVDWSAGTAFSRSIVPGQTTVSERWYRRFTAHTQTWSRQVDGRIMSDSGMSPWSDLVFSQSADGIAGLRARYAVLLRQVRGTAASRSSSPVVRRTAVYDLLPAPLPGPMMQRSTVVWLDTRTGLPVTVLRSLLPYVGGSDETEICRTEVLQEIARRDAPSVLAGPPTPSLWDRLTGLATRLRHVTRL